MKFDQVHALLRAITQVEEPHQRVLGGARRFGKATARTQIHRCEIDRRLLLLLNHFHEVDEFSPERRVDEFSPERRVEDPHHVLPKVPENYRELLPGLSFAVQQIALGYGVVFEGDDPHE